MLQLKDYIFRRHKKGDHVAIYEISDQDVAATTKYYGYLTTEGGWIIQAFDTTTGQYRYCAGESLYEANWIARAGLTYVLYSQLL